MRNMYGCAPCPDCGSKRRWPSAEGHPEHPNSIICDDCGRVKPHVYCHDVDGGFYNERVGGERIEEEEK